MLCWISEEPTPQLPSESIAGAIQSHFLYRRKNLDRQIREHMRRGQLFLLIGLSLLIGFLTLAELTVRIPPGPVRQILREGLVITGWVAMWRPLEVLFYDWWPLVRQRRLTRRLLDARVTVHHEQCPPVLSVAA